jgi:hypothetical protein
MRGDLCLRLQYYLYTKRPRSAHSNGGHELRQRPAQRNWNHWSRHGTTFHGRFHYVDPNPNTPVGGVSTGQLSVTNNGTTTFC